MSAGARTQATDNPGGLSVATLTELEWLEQQYRLRPVDISPAPAGAVAASHTVLNGGASFLCGWALRETTGAAAAAIRLWDGASNNDQLLLTLALASGAGDRYILDRHGIWITTGRVFLEVVAGSVEGLLYIR